MMITIAGGGLAGCSLGRVLAESGHTVNILEKADDIGGLCRTHYSEEGLKYEMGGHIFHTNNQRVIDFIKRFCDLGTLTHYVGARLNQNDPDEPIKPWPLTQRSIDLLPERFQKEISFELRNLPQKPDSTNFDTYMRTTIGNTLYELFVKRYTERMWGRFSHTLSADWAPKRLKPVGDDERLFGNETQFYPLPDYNAMFKNMTNHKDVTVYKGTTLDSVVGQALTEMSDLVISTIPIDELFGKGLGELEFTGLEQKFWKAKVGKNNLPGKYGTINYPYSRHDFHSLRTAEFGKINGQDTDVTMMCSDTPNRKLRHYPIKTPENEELFKKYLSQLCQQNKVMTFGRLGLFVYADMDDTVNAAFRMAKLVDRYKMLSPSQRVLEYNTVRKFLRG
jgi:UDP-galactopyranose mutase